MCDPFSIGLTLVGTGLQAYGQSQVAGAQKRDINAMGQSYEAERARQAGFQGENAKTVADTLATYSRPSMDAMYSDATANRQKAYVSPLESKSFVADTPADYAPNSAVAGRNAQTGAERKSYSLAQALSKAKLDAYGDAQQKAGFMAGNNANQIATTDRIASGSEHAEAVNQGTLGTKLQADQGAGKVAGGIGDLFTMAGMLNGMGGGGLGKSLFGGSVAPIPYSANLGQWGTLSGTSGSPAFAGMFG